MAQGYSVRTITQLTGLNEHTLRAWEKRYGAVVPKRSTSGQRRYSAHDVERLRILVDLVRAGHAIGRIATLPDSDLRATLAKTQRLQQAAESPADRSPDLPPPAHAARFLQPIETALVSYDLDLVNHNVQRAAVQLGVRQYLLDVVSPLMGTIGRLVLEEHISIAQEHALSAIFRVQLGTMMATLSHREPGGEAKVLPSFALSTIEGDLHEIGIMISAVLCAAHGAPCHYFGASLPPAALGEAARVLRSSVVVIGTTPLPPGLIEWSIRDYAAEVRRQISEQCEIWVGGDGDFGVDDLAPAQPARRVKSLVEFDSLLARMVSGQAEAKPS